MRARREALRALAQLPAEMRWPILIALSDPVWRVRRDAVKVLLAWHHEDPGLLGKLRARLAQLGQEDARTAGAVKYLEFLATPGAEPPPRPVSVTAAEEPWRGAAWWDDDPPVLLENLRHLTEAQVRADLALLPGLLTLLDGRPVWPYLRGVFHFVVAALERFGEPDHLAAAVRLLDEPRRPWVAEWIHPLLDRMTPEHRRMLREGADPPGQPGPPVRAMRPPSPPEPEVTLGRLRSWEVPPSLPHARPLGKTGLVVSPLGLSGRYSLPERGFRAAIDAGVNLFFWEPGYDAQTRCWQRLAPSLRDRLVVVAGSFAADARSVRRDLEQALRLLQVPRLGVFLLFWVRSPGRLREETLEALAEAREEGLVTAVGLSTHLRPLAVEAVRDGWDVVMVRHSLAHRGAEEELFPLAHEAGAGVLTFSSLCYGRLPQAPRPTPADCYRYSLSQRGVSACLTAPRDLDQLRHNLQVLACPTLDPQEQAALWPSGDAVYRQHRAFVGWLRSRS